MSGRTTDGDAHDAPVLLVRAAGGEDRDAEALTALGIRIVEDPYLVVAPCGDGEAAMRAERVLRALRDDVDVLLLSSRAAVRALDALVGRAALLEAVELGVARGLWGAAVGPATAQTLRELGIEDVHEPEVATSRGLLAALRARSAAGAGPQRALLPCGAQAMKGLAAGLVADGWDVDEVVVYTTEEVTTPPASVADLAGGRIAAVVLRSPTAVRAVARRVPELPHDTVVVSGGPTTAAAVAETWRERPAGSSVVSDGPTPEAVARTVAQALAVRAAHAAGAAGAEGAER
jgi:uroporphyrinogen decarboxylase